ncbi:MAG: sigma-70 family RNA polymerase sigma factor [Myxococcota bacterium]
MTGAPEFDREFLDRVFLGDPTAFKDFYERYSPTVRWAVGMRVYRWPQLAPLLDDITQEVWLQLTRRRFKVLRYYNAAYGASFSRFLAVVSARLGWRIAKRRLEHPVEEMGPNDELDNDDLASRLINADILSRLVRMMKNRLEADDIQLFTRHFVEGEPLKDIGRAMGISDDAVYQRKHRLQKKILYMADDLIESELGKPAKTTL